MTTQIQITPVILCGGNGTRLWPLSRKSFPKQFVPLIDGKSLLQLTLERVGRVSPHAPKSTLCVAAEDHRCLVADAMQAARVGSTVILEPCVKNTAAAMALAALQAQPQDLLLFCPADHHIPDAAAFAAMVQQGCAAAMAGAIVTFGVMPSLPSTAYGYIQRGAPSVDGHSSQVARFIEKPSAAKAQQLLLQGDVLWNAGIFLVQTQVLIDALQAHAPDILLNCQQAMAAASRDQSFIRPQPAAFTDCRAESIDYAVLEHHAHVAVVPFSGAWSDVGSWTAVAELTPP
ncbi:MAG: mannose-1-phosphate guanylyltransferase, partial [Polaromonas sp.]